MSSVNKVMLLGNLTAEPDVRGFANGQQVCNLKLATNREYMGANGQKVSDTCFVDIAVFGKMATTCKQFLYKGAQIFVEGRLVIEQWQTKSGEQRQKLKVVSENIQFCDISRRERNPPRPPENQGGYTVSQEFAPDHYQAKANGYQPESSFVNDDDYVNF